MKKSKKNIDIGAVMPLIIFFVITLAAVILTGGQVFAVNNILNIINQAVPYLLAGVGMIFAVAMGGTDITCGSIIGLAGTAGA